MKKISKIIMILIFTLILSGCKEILDADRFANISNKDKQVLLNEKNNYNFTFGELYEEMKEHDEFAAFRMIFARLVKDKFLKEEYEINWFNKKINEKMLEKIENEPYYQNGVYNEELFVTYLETMMFEINCESSSEYLDEEIFTCNYDDYIDRYIKFEIYQELLSSHYIFNEKIKDVKKGNFRKINYLEVNKDTSDSEYKTYNDLADFITKLSNEEDGFLSIEDVIEALKDVEKAKIQKTYDELSSFSDLQKFIKCEDLFCSPEESLLYQLNEIDEKEYLKIEYINTFTEELFNESILERLTSKSLEGRLLEINGKNYFTNVENTSNVTSIIISDDSKYYIIQVDEIDLEEMSEEVLNAFSTLADELNAEDVLTYYFGDLELDFYDEIVEEYVGRRYNKKD